MNRLEDLTKEELIAELVRLRLSSAPMPLRDWFAGQAMQGLMSDASYEGETAGTSYRMADAMLKARGTPAPQVEETPVSRRRAPVATFVKQDQGGATVATILQAEGSIVEVQDLGDGRCDLIVHGERPNRAGTWDDLTAHLRAEHFDMLGSVADYLRQSGR